MREPTEYNGLMNTIIEYLEQEQRTFSELAFSPADSLVLSTLAYFNFDAAGVVERQSPDEVLLHDAVALTPLSALVSSCWLADAPETGRFVSAVASSRRLRDVRVKFFVNDLVSVVEKQFSAVTFVMPAAASAFAADADGPAQPRRMAAGDAALAGDRADDLVYIAFRGTDGTLAGWKEDFNLTFKGVIPSQAAALQYLSGVASTCFGPLLAGGHSKGGNLAEYSTLTCDEALYERIVRVYDHDGPAFFDDPSPRISEPGYRGKLHKTVPSSSIFGMMLEKRGDYRIVQTDAIAFLSHSPFKWLLDGADFAYDDKLTRGSVAFDRSLDAWLRSVDADKRELFIDTMYELFSSTEATTWIEFQDNLPKNVAHIVKSGYRLDSDTRAFLLRTMMRGIGLLTSTTARTILPGRSRSQSVEKGGE